MYSQQGRGPTAPLSIYGMNVHQCILRYTVMNDNDLRLGTFVKVYAGNTTLTLSQNIIRYSCVHPHPFQSQRRRSQ
jgi:hypothetical protein